MHPFEIIVVPAGTEGDRRRERMNEQEGRLKEQLRGRRGTGQVAVGDRVEIGVVEGGRAEESTVSRWSM